MELLFQKKGKGFTLVELLVVVTIISIMSVGAVVGFGNLGSRLTAKQIVNLIQDSIKQSELRVLAGDYESVQFSFKSDYLVLNQNPETATLSLRYDDPVCPDGVLVGADGNLTKKDQGGRILSVTSQSQDDCVVEDFTTSEEREWVYQLSNNGAFSNEIRLFHFNLDRDNLDSSKLFELVIDPADAVFTIQAPYAKKIYSNDPITINIDLLEDPENTFSPEILTLQP